MNTLFPLTVTMTFNYGKGGSEERNLEVHDVVKKTSPDGGVSTQIRGNIFDFQDIFQGDHFLSLGSTGGGPRAVAIPVPYTAESLMSYFGKCVEVKAIDLTEKRAATLLKHGLLKLLPAPVQK